MHNVHLERRQAAQEIWRAGVAAVQPKSCIPQALNDLAGLVQGWSAERQYVVIGGGKAGAAMGQAVVEFLSSRGAHPDNIRGWLNVPEEPGLPHLQSITLHPARPAGVNFPTPAAVAGTLQMLQMVDAAPSDALVLCLVSGGGSALLTAPVPEVPLADKVQVSKQLSAAGASIGQLNAVRKHLSQIKGGGLAQRCFRPGVSARQLISLIISDVIGDPLDVIASGPTAPDPTTFEEALTVLDQLGIRSHIPPSVEQYLSRGHMSLHPETMKSLPAPEPLLIHRIIANNQMAQQAAGQRAMQLGYPVIHWGDQWAGDTSELAHVFVQRLKTGELPRPACILSGGETTVRLPTHPGKGGRNQNLALAMLDSLGQEGLRNITLLCGGTDGEDGPTDAAGAFSDLGTWNQAHRLKLKSSAFLARCDAYPYFEATGSLFRTGLNQTNVMDLRVFLVH